MQRFTCPSCGAELVFQSAVSVYAVCKYCASMIVRHDKDVESIGTMAQLPDDISPLQIGTDGIYRGTHFGIVGRAKIGWEDGSWNEWYLVFDDGRRGWLAEAQGCLAVSFEVEDGLHPGTREILDKYVNGFDPKEREKVIKSLGSYLAISGKLLQIADIKEAECIGSEGELPFAAAKGRKATYADLIGENGEFGGIEYASDGIRVYAGSYEEFDKLHFSNLRELEGWGKASNGS